MGLGASLQAEMSIEQKASRVVRYHADSSLKDFKSAAQTNHQLFTPSCSARIKMTHFKFLNRSEFMLKWFFSPLKFSKYISEPVLSPLYI